jgi:serine/threonine-protein kinase
MAQAFRCPACRHKFVPASLPADGRLVCPACQRELRIPIRSPLPEKDSSRMIGDYRVGRKLGSGATAVVYEAEHAKSGAKVALKVLTEEAAVDAEFLQRFRREADLARKLKHPNIIGIHGFGADGRTYYLAMELVDGPTFEDEIDRLGRYDWREACRIVLEVADALVEAQKLGIIHRDIKPANIMLAGGKTAKLADLGFGKQLTGSTAGEELTMAGVAMGSPAYMPPEQVLDAKQATAASDCYSLGATLYHAVTGKLPFDGSNSHVVMERVLREEAPAPRSLVPDLPAGVDAFLRWTLIKDTGRRPQTATEFASELRAVIERPDDAARLRKRLGTGGGRLWLWIVLAIGAVLAVVGGVLALSR